MLGRIYRQAPRPKLHLVIKRTKHFSSYSKKSLTGPVYMASNPHREPTKVDRDGVPVLPYDETPVGPENRPKRKEVDWAHGLTVNMKKFNALKWHYTRPSYEESIKQHPSPKIPPIIPEPRNGMTVELFLKKIGRGCDQYADKFTSWEHFWSIKKEQLKALGVTAPSDRKYILRWKNYYRLGTEPYFIRLKSKAKKNMELPWRQALITQKEKRIELGLDE